LDNFKNDFINARDVPNIKKELNYFAKNPFKNGEQFKLEQFIEFITFNKNGEANIYQKLSSSDKKNGQGVFRTEVMIKKFPTHY